MSDLDNMTTEQIAVLAQERKLASIAKQRRKALRELEDERDHLRKQIRNTQKLEAKHDK